MADRKVLNKYYPPDFDPEMIPRRKMPKDRQYKVRLMAPFNMRCTTCGEYIYKGKKFNAVKETVLDQDYLGLPLFRFYIRCTLCAAEIAFRTDPENTDYKCEIGATRNFEGWRAEADPEFEDDPAETGDADEQNPMAALEERTKESKREMDILDALEEIKDSNSRKMNVNLDDLIKAKQEAKEKLLKERKEKKAKEAEEAIENAVKEVFDTDRVKRLSSDEEEEEGSSKKPTTTKRKKNFAEQPDDKKKPKLTSERKIGSLGLSSLAGLVKRKDTQSGKVVVKPTQAKPKTSGLLTEYSDSSDSN
eukprot:m.29789 g.29789  ORF g.29789 m.29789 type:complete len:305 (+) comp8136_c0_seq1:200-1114(+)